MPKGCENGLTVLETVAFIMRKIVSSKYNFGWNKGLVSIWSVLKTNE